MRNSKSEANSDFPGGLPVLNVIIERGKIISRRSFTPRAILRCNIDSIAVRWCLAVPALLAARWWRSLVGSALSCGARRWRARASVRSFSGSGSVVVLAFPCWTRAGKG